MSLASINAEKTTTPSGESTETRKTVHKPFTRAGPQDKIFIFLLAFRLLNALVVKTFFQPDEYYQALEPAWRLAFGDNSGAWITWEWRNSLRSSLHPAFFALAFSVANTLASFLKLSSPMRASLLLAAPKIAQAGIAAVGDYYTYKLAKHVYGKDSPSAWLTLVLTVGSAWQWFCATRTFSNCAETTLTIIALYNWPFHWALGTDEVGFQVDGKALRIRQTDDTGSDENNETTHLRRALFCAATAVVLRPTNVIIWFTLTLATFGRGMWHHGIHWEVSAFIKESVLCGSTVLTLSALVDRVFYGAWAFPPWSFLKFNVLQSLAVFYGNNNWHYYLSQGYPLLLTVAIVPTGFGIYQSLVLRTASNGLGIQAKLILHRLALISIALPAALSILSHKEVRFIYPILPAIHILAAMPLAKMLNLVDSSGNDRGFTYDLSKLVTPSMVILGALNIAIALYTSLVHNAGSIAVTEFLRSEYETVYRSDAGTAMSNLTFAAFMPCHSTPWRSHIQYPPTSANTGISGWALTCEPPLNLNSSAKAVYLDEADRFYLDPIAWINKHMSRDLPLGPARKAGVYAPDPADSRKLWNNSFKGTGIWLQQEEGGSDSDRARKSRSWPDYLIFYEHLEPLMRRMLDDSAYKECRRFFNSHAHDDWRRKGDIVVWCVHPGSQPARRNASN